MVLGIAMMSAMLPTMIGLNEATSSTHDREESRRDSSRKQRCHIVATCSLNQGNQRQREQVHNAKVYVGLDGKVCPQQIARPHPVEETNESAIHHQTSQIINGSLQRRLPRPSSLRS